MKDYRTASSPLSAMTFSSFRAGPAGRVSRSDPQLTLFELKDDALRAALDAVDLDRITPLEAMRLLAELKNLRRDQ